MKVYLLDANKQMKTGYPMPIKLQLSCDDGKPVSSKVLEVDSNLRISNQAVGEVRLRFNDYSSNHGDRNFVLRATPGNSASLARAEVANSPAFSVVKYRLEIKTAVPDIWYKDEGGRDKCIIMDVQLRDSCNTLVRGVDLPLRWKLRYREKVL